ncbi:MAG: NAD(P)/FAD-dependent oxidoreductase, partial [Verrucomicrobiae bacterium]|nr:NAD(P)/FAD-dependent oxidoreductase [Verrucomicrobiae bacterium]
SATMPATYDAILLGTGHNALILQAYLARQGLSTLSLDQAPVAGGGLSTLEWPTGSGFLHNPHSFYHRGITDMPWFRDLDLAAHGANYLTPPLNVALLTSDGASLEWHTDFEKTVASFARFSQRDAEALRRWRDAFRPIVREILLPEAASPPLPPDERRLRLQQTSHGRLLLETSELSPIQFVRREFEHPAVQAGLLFFNGLREVDLRLPGFGHHIPALLASDRYAQMPVGGAARLAEALVADIRNHGGEIRTHSPMSRLVIEHGRVAGVKLSDGEAIRATRLVASGLNPQQTFLELLDPADVPADWRRKAMDFRYNLIAPLFGLYLNLGEAPNYRTPSGNEALMVILGLDRADQFEEIVSAHEIGRVPSCRVMWGSSPTRFDSSQAPEGRHTAFLWEKLPYHLNGHPSDWDVEKDRHGERMLEMWSRYAPNLGASETVLDAMTRSPLDVERTLPNMRHGDLLIGAFAQGQTGYHRPFPGAGHYRTCIDGLYLCGSCCHPGGNITGLPGYNAAQVISADLGLSFPLN